jgi:hypothetical protein
LAFWQKASKAVRPLLEKNSGGTESLTVVIVAIGVATLTKSILGFVLLGVDDGLAKGVGDNADAGLPLPFSVDTPSTIGVPDFMRSRGKSRNANETISWSISGSSDSKVIWALFGRDIETFTMLTLR